MKIRNLAKKNYRNCINIKILFHNWIGHMESNYKIESLFMAGTIFDRYMMDIGHWNFPRENILKLSLTSLLLAAKL